MEPRAGGAGTGDGDGLVTLKEYMHDESPGDKGEIRGGSGALILQQVFAPFSSDKAEGVHAR